MNNIFTSAIIICGLSLCYACDILIDISKVGIITRESIQRSKIIIGNKIFNKYEVFQGQLGSFIKIGNKIFTFDDMLDSCKLNFINKLLSNENFNIKNLNLYIRELFELNTKYHLIDPFKDTVIYSLDTTANKRLKQEFAIQKIPYEDYKKYYQENQGNTKGKVYVLNEKRQDDVEYLANPNFYLVFVYITMHNNTFKINKITSNAAYKLIHEK